MRIGIVGVGSMGQTHAVGWSKTSADLVGFIADKPETAAPVAAKHKARAFGSLEELLADVDVVDVCAPTHLHHEIVLRAAAAGKDIVCEKPLARTLPQAREIIAACRAAGVKLTVGHVVRYFPEYALARQKVADGEIGRPAVIRLRRGTFQPRNATDNWFLDPAKSGGLMLDLMIHDFDYARWVVGEVTTVYCKHIGDPARSPGDHGLAILTHASGALTHVEGSWAYPPPTFRTQFEIAGSEGLLLHDSAATAPIGVFRHQTAGDEAGDVPVPASPLLESPYTTQLRAFYDHLRHDAPVPVSAEDGLAALQIALAAIESATNGNVVEIGSRK